MGEGRGQWSNKQPVSNRKSFSFSNQLLHFSLDTICLHVEREKKSEVLKPRSLLIKLSPWTQGPKNYLGPQVLTSYFYVRFRAVTAGGPYFLLLFLRSFPCSNCRRSLLLTFTFTFVFAQQLTEVFTSYFYFYVRFRVATAEGLYFLFLLLRPFLRSNYRRSLLLTFTFTSVFAQQLSEVFTSYFYFYVCFRAITAVVNGGGIFGIWRVGEEIWVRFFWAKGLGGSWF